MNSTVTGILPPTPPTTTISTKKRNTASGNIEEDTMDVEDHVEVEEGVVLSVESVGIGYGPIWSKYIASGGMDKSLKIWDITSGGCRLVCM